MLSTLWLTRQKIGCSPPLYHTTFSAPTSPPILARRPGLRKRGHPFTLPLTDDKQFILRVLYRAVFLLSGPRFVFSLYLVFLATVNSCELQNSYLVLNFFLMYSSSGLSNDVFPNKTNINIAFI